MAEAFKFSILVVEDDEALSSTLVETLSDFGFATIGTKTVREANFKLKNQQFSCVVLDIRLGNETGEIVIDSMRENTRAANHDTPVVLMSGFLDQDLLKKIGPKVQGAIVKPFTPKDLLKKLKPLLIRSVKKD